VSRAIIGVLQLMRLRFPPVALAQHANEEWLHSINPLAAILPRVRGFTVHCLLRHAPAQIDVEELQSQPLAAFAQFREHDGDEVIPLRMHVLERAADEDADFVFSVRHGVMRMSKFAENSNLFQSSGSRRSLDPLKEQQVGPED
jgi:hypothetical protein